MARHGMTRKALRAAGTNSSKPDAWPRSCTTPTRPDWRGSRSTASAVRGGFKTPPGVGRAALFLEPGDLDQDEIIHSVGEGVFVQGVSGVHSGVNRVSGDFSVGAEGLMIRDGMLAEPVREYTIASTIQRLLQRVLFVGGDVEYLPSSAAGVSLAIADVAMAGE